MRSCRPNMGVQINDILIVSLYLEYACFVLRQLILLLSVTYFLFYMNSGELPWRHLDDGDNQHKDGPL